MHVVFLPLILDHSFTIFLIQTDCYYAHYHNTLLIIQFLESILLSSEAEPPNNKKFPILESFFFGTAPEVVAIGLELRQFKN